MIVIGAGVVGTNAGDLVAELALELALELELSVAALAASASGSLGLEAGARVGREACGSCCAGSSASAINTMQPIIVIGKTRPTLVMVLSITFAPLTADAKAFNIRTRLSSP